jgi:hypothetical protein
MFDDDAIGPEDRVGRQVLVDPRRGRRRQHAALGFS